MKEGEADPTPERDDYDNPWKEALERYFPEFLEFYFPFAHRSIDWLQGHLFLDQELREVTRDAQLGKRYVDKLVRVALLDGPEQWVYVHVEVQGEREAGFGERMFVYNYRLYDRYRRPVASLAVLADGEPLWRPAAFGYELFGCRVGIEFALVKLAQWEADLAGLTDSPNAFALVTAAHLLTRTTRGDPAGRYDAKLRLIRLLYKKGWERQRVVDLLAVLDWMMRLPEPLSRRLREEVAAIEESEKMRYVTSFERLAREDGRAEGLEQGRQQGRLEGGVLLLARQLESRFGPLPESVLVRLKGASEEDLLAWGQALLTAPSLEAVFGQPRH